MGFCLFFIIGWRKRNDQVISTLVEKKQRPASVVLAPDNIPKHVAIIMDGNGRWARRLGLPRIVGHRTGMKAVKRATIAADELGISVLTLYAFSTENWKRPKDEVDFLMSLPQEFLAIELDELIEKNVRVRMMGYTDMLPPHTIAAMEEATERTKHNTGLILNFALNYGGRREIAESVKAVARLVQNGEACLWKTLPPIRLIAICYRRGCLSRICSSGPEANCGSATLCFGKRLTANCGSRMFTGRNSSRSI